MTSFTPSPEQSAFFTELTAGSRNILLSAVAGSGKTTTIVQATRLLPPGRLVKFLAFNKNIQTELESRLPQSCLCRTFHSEGFGVLKRHFGKSPKLDQDKLFKILKTRLQPREFELLFSSVLRLVGYAKNAGLRDDSEHSAWRDLICHFDLDTNGADERRVIEVSQKLLRESTAESASVIDFDDMLYVPLVLDLSFDLCGFLFIDEAQDTNYVQRTLLRRMLSPSGRLIAVGDPHQAIYGFRGADSNAIAALTHEFDMLEMPLSVSFRCSQKVVAEARKYLREESVCNAAPFNCHHTIENFETEEV